MKHLGVAPPLALTLVLGACGSQTGTAPTPPTETPPTEQPPITPTPPANPTLPTNLGPPTNPASPDDPSDDVELVEFHAYRTEGSNLATGVVRNNGTTSMEFLELTANFYDDEGVLIGTDYSDREVSLPGETSSFSLLSVGDALETLENCEALAEWNQTSEVPVRDLEVSGINHNGDTLLGQITNNGGGNYQYLEVTSNRFNDAGDLADVSFTFAEADVLAPGRSSSFSINIYAGRDELETCEVFAEGLPL